MSDYSTQSTGDEQHLRLLSLFHYVLGVSERPRGLVLLWAPYKPSSFYLILSAFICGALFVPLRTAYEQFWIAP